MLIDSARISHVFGNLLTNAAKYTAPGGSVSITAAAEGDDWVRFAVADTGVGIPPEHLPRVFDRFFRVPGRKSVAGAGLGLAIAREIVQAHGGSIDVRSREGRRGRASASRCVRPTRRWPLPVFPHSRHRHEHEQTGVCVLVTDDESNIRLLLRTALESEGYAVSEAADGRSALDAVRQHTPDLMVLDLNMPVLDGMAVLEQMKLLAIANKPRVIVLTAYGSIPTAVRATRLGAADFLEKPITPAALRESVHSVLTEPELDGSPTRNGPRPATTTKC